jgi:hypothetical protein
MSADVRFYIGGTLAGWLAGWPHNPMDADVRFYIGEPLAGWLAAELHGRQRQILHRRAAGWLAGWPQKPMGADVRFYIGGPLAGWLALKAYLAPGGWQRSCRQPQVSFMGRVQATAQTPSIC